MKFDVRIFMGDKEVTRAEIKKYAIRSNTVDRIVNSVADRVDPANRHIALPGK